MFENMNTRVIRKATWKFLIYIFISDLTLDKINIYWTY